MVYNPIKVDLDAIKKVVAAAEAKAGWGETLWFETSKEDPGQGAAQDALDAGASVVIAAGGDCTVRAVAEVVHGSDVLVLAIAARLRLRLRRSARACRRGGRAPVPVPSAGSAREVGAGVGPPLSREQLGLRVVAVNGRGAS